MKKKRSLQLFSSWALILLFLAGCSSESEEDTSEAEDQTESAQVEDETEEEENDSTETEASIETTDWDKTFPESDEVTHEKVTFENRFGIELAADMYTPAGSEDESDLPAIIVGHPFGGVKEQTSGLYAQEMAERGYVTIAFDASYTGESGGEPRNIASPEVFSEDFSAAVDFLGTEDLVDRERIGVLGMCGSGGFALNAAQVDPRIASIATVSMYDMGRAHREGLGFIPTEDELMTEEDYSLALEESAEQRWDEAEGAETDFDLVGEAVELQPSSEEASAEFAEYYETERGEHPRSLPFNLTSRAALMNFEATEQIENISPRPLLFVAGENAHSISHSEDAYEMAGENSELYIVPNAGHIDLYDDTDLIPFEELERFYGESL